MYFRNSYWIESKKNIFCLWYFPLCSGLIFCWKKQKPPQNIKKCPKNRVLFLEQFRLSRTISTPLEFPKISVFRKNCFSWFALYLDPIDWKKLVSFNKKLEKELSRKSTCSLYSVWGSFFLASWKKFGYPFRFKIGSPFDLWCFQSVWSTANTIYSTYKILRTQKPAQFWGFSEDKSLGGLDLHWTFEKKKTKICFENHFSPWQTYFLIQNFFN